MINEEEFTTLTETQVRAIVQDEMSKVISNTRTHADRTIHQKDIQILDARYIQVGRTNGTMIGTASEQKIGLYGTTPVAKQGAITAPTGAGTSGVDSPARTAINAIINTLKAIGITN
jgi:hypothetical protein